MGNPRLSMADEMPAEEMPSAHVSWFGSALWNYIYIYIYIWLKLLQHALIFAMFSMPDTSFYLDDNGKACINCFHRCSANWKEGMSDRVFITLAYVLTLLLWEWGFYSIPPYSLSPLTFNRKGVCFFFYPRRWGNLSLHSEGVKFSGCAMCVPSCSRETR